jgi:pimeloyl-ACP methyl ester carboxylesterase
MACDWSDGIPKHRGEQQLSTQLPPLPAGLTEHRYDTKDVTLNYATGERNGLPIILIHGLGGMLHEFLSVYELLKDRWQVTLVDLRGHGKSSWTTAGYDFSNYHSDIISLMRDVIGGPAVVWGHSLGAITTMNITARAPELVTAAILEDPPMMIAGEQSDSPFLLSFKRTQDLMRSGATYDEILIAVRAWQPGLSDSSYDARLAAIVGNDPDIYSSPIAGRARESWDPEEVLAEIHVPTLLMQADHNVGAAVMDEHASLAMNILPNARHIKYEGIGHGIHSALPEKTVADVETFVAEMVGAA